MRKSEGGGGGVVERVMGSELKAWVQSKFWYSNEVGPI